LDPGGDIVRYVKNSGSGRQHEGWTCYHTEMWVVDVNGLEIGVVGMAVGASFAVLVAEQLAVSGARLTISVTSAGRITESLELPCFVLIERALRDEGTSAHYQPPAKWSHLAEPLRGRLNGALTGLREPVVVGDSWTTDAP
jgi:uridine phosphorylase